jgi:hypothetical protein
MCTAMHIAPNRNSRLDSGAAGWVGWLMSHQLGDNPHHEHHTYARKRGRCHAYAKILGCSESEFLNRYLELKLDPLPADYDYPTAEVMETVFAPFTFKSREEAQRVLDWFCTASKADALARGERIRIKTEIFEVDARNNFDALSLGDLEEVFWIRATTCYLDEENRIDVICYAPDLLMGPLVEKALFQRPEGE